MSEHGRVYGLAAEFESPEQLVEAARAVREEGFEYFEAYSPYPIRELDEIVPMWNLVPLITLLAGAAGALTGYYLQYLIAAIVYPLNIGGRPLNSWPAFIPIIFELTVLFASCAAFFSTLYFAGFPALYHPMFRIPSFRRASDDGFFLCVEARDTAYHGEATAQFLHSLDPLRVWEVEHE
jgi:hypothetical protein